jgi:molybdate transport system ATP-binding protein
MQNHDRLSLACARPATPRLIFHCRHRYPSGFQLDAQFEAGDGVTALVGPSGAGKSTILSLIAGILKAQEGSIRLGDMVLLDTARRLGLPPERRKVGLVFQDQLLFEHMTVRGNLRYGQRRRPARAIDFDRVVDVLELRELLDRRPRTLSGGQRQRTALGRTLLHGPELLLLDEPLSGLDAALKDRIVEYLSRAFAEWKIPTLLVSHSGEEVDRMAERTVTMADGRIVEA